MFIWLRSARVAELEKRVKELTDRNEDLEESYTNMSVRLGVAEDRVSKMQLTTSPNKIEQEVVELVDEVEDIYADGYPSVAHRRNKVGSVLKRMLMNARVGDDY